MAIPKHLADDHLPGLGDQYEVGLQNVGRTVVYHTLALNTPTAHADIVASPPNTVAVAGSVVLHSLGIEPTLAVIQPYLTSVTPVDFALVTMNASAVFVKSTIHSYAAQAVSARIVVIR